MQGLAVFNAWMLKSRLFSFKYLNTMHILMIRLLILLIAVQVGYAQTSPFIHVDQFGYLTGADKVAVLSDPQVGFNASESFSPGSLIELVDAGSNSAVYSASPVAWNGGATQGSSGDRGWWFDFSSVTIPGSYFIRDQSSGEVSATFSIHANPYVEVLNAAFKAFYYNRCNYTKEAPFAQSGWTDGMNFDNALQDANCRYVNDRDNSGLEKDLSGGWFDAGDYNKYVTFAHAPVHDLLSLYEENTAICGDNWNIPESGNGIPDILDEVQWELDWLMKMSNPDGSVHIKMGSIDYGDNILAPPSLNTDQRFYGPTCSSASIAVSSMFAHAASVFGSVTGREAYASSLQARAVACWNAFILDFDAGTLDEGCDDGTIKAGDADRSAAEQKEVALIAAIYLFDLTGTESYHDFIKDHYDEVETISSPYWGPYKISLIDALLFYTTLEGNDPGVETGILNAAVTEINNNYSGFFSFEGDDLYRAQVPDNMYHWGSNMPKAHVGNLCHILKKYDVLPGASDGLAEKAAEQLHYFHGVNPMGLVYLSNMYEFGGDRCADEIYHTWFQDGSVWDNAQTSTYGPAPGFLVGGPNKNFSLGHLSPPANQPPQKSYLDFNTSSPDNSWEITEPAIYYQSAYLRFLANYLESNPVTSSINLKLSNDCIEVYPNPTGSNFHIAGVLNQYKLEIYDSNGGFVQSIPNVGSDAMVDLSALPAGTFLIRVENLQNHSLCVQKILKQ